ncbi:MAG: hypothetical protein Q8O84_02110 [Nanoarchaeota archaeon]|nr:hypothetical protein [Nanoarchaeota archaeon]
MKNYNDDIFYSTWSYVGANVTKYGGALLGITETIGSDHSLNSLGVIALSGGLFIGGTLWDRFTTRVQ